MMARATTFTGGRRKTAKSPLRREIERNAPPISERFHQSVTDRRTFRDCRRKWLLETVKRLGPKNQVAWHLIFGDVVHTSLEAYYVNDRNAEFLFAVFEAEWERMDNDLQRNFGGLYSMGIEAEWFDWKQKGLAMLRFYDRFDRENMRGPGQIFNWEKVLAVNIEERSYVPILNKRRHPFPGHPLLSGRIDLVVQRSDGVWIIDHKTANQKPSLRALEVDDQLTGYCYIWWRITGQVPRGAIYNVLVKEPPKPPRVLADGSLSKDKAQRTTFALYMDAINELGLNVADYEGYLDYLSRKGWSSFYVRDGSTRTLDELMSFEERLRNEYKDMRACIKDESLCYPNPSQWNCQNCSVISLCQTMEEKGDPTYLIENGFEVKEPRYSIPKGV